MSEPVYYPGRVVWRELMSNDFDRARAFYAELFGWKTSDMPMPDGSVYTIFMAGEEGVGGGMMMPPGVEAPSHWCSYVSVPDVDASLAAAQRLGGRGLYEPMNVPGVGRMVGIMDFDGAVFAVMRGERGDMPPAERPGVGTFCWETLVTTDIPRAKEFYGAVVGWQDGQGPGGGADMDIFAAGDAQVADIQPSRGVPPHWLTYVVVDSHASSRDRAAAMGAHVLVPSIAVPHVGHIAVIADPTGAALGLFEPAS